jgi:hypothetical protein
MKTFFAMTGLRQGARPYGHNCSKTAPFAIVELPNMLTKRDLLITRRIPLSLKTSYHRRPECEPGSVGGNDRAGAMIEGS